MSASPTRSRIDAGLIDAAAEASVADPLALARLTTPQAAFCASAAQRLLWRGGNTIGKSYAAAYDLIHAARGTHPLRRVPRGPARLLVVSESWAQMDPLCEKIWALLPKGEIDPVVYYEPGEGFRGYREPHIAFRSGPGAGSVIHFATYAQGSGRIAGGQFHGIWGDEPMPQSVYGELLPRLSRYNGTFRITMTPTPESPPLAYLREIIERSKAHKARHGTLPPGGWEEQQTSITLDALTLRGALVEHPWKTAAELTELLESYLDIERGMREHGDWDAVVAGRWLSAYGPKNEFDGADPTGTLYLAVGIDHGAKAGRQAAVLVACSEDGDHAWYLDECISDGRTSSREDAEAILAMVRRHGWEWDAVDHWVGDRAHGGDRYGNAKSNADLMHEFSDILGVSESRLRAKGLDLATPYKAHRSVSRGLRVMNSLFKQEQASVHCRCPKLIEAIKNWEGALDDPLKDRLDAARYATERLLEARRLRPRVEAAARIY